MPFISGKAAKTKRHELKREWHALNKQRRANTKALMHIAKDPVASQSPEALAIARENADLSNRMWKLEQEFEQYIVYGERIDTPLADNQRKRQALTSC